MNKKGLITKLIITATFGILILGILPVVQAGTPPFIQDLDSKDNLLKPFMDGEWIEDPPGRKYKEWEFDSSRNLHFRYGLGASYYELENDLFPKPPWRYRLYINGEEIDLQRYNLKGDKDIMHPSVWFFWYHIFGPDYFTAGGEYLLKFELWVKAPYQGDGLNYWRIFIDYMGHLSPEGIEWSFEYYLNIV